eukprot:358157-Chlamydomonas_euryale.AAC.1
MHPRRVGRPWSPAPQGLHPRRVGRPWSPAPQGLHPRRVGRPWSPAPQGMHPRRVGRPWSSALQGCVPLPPEPADVVAVQRYEGLKRAFTPPVNLESVCEALSAANCGCCMRAFTTPSAATPAAPDVASAPPADGRVGTDHDPVGERQHHLRAGVPGVSVQEWGMRGVGKRSGNTSAASCGTGIGGELRCGCFSNKRPQQCWVCVRGSTSTQVRRKSDARVRRDPTSPMMATLRVLALAQVTHHHRPPDVGRAGSRV